MLLKFILLLFYNEMLFLLCVVRGRSSDPFLLENDYEEKLGKSKSKNKNRRFPLDIKSLTMEIIITE